MGQCRTALQGLLLMILGQNRAFVPLYFEEVEIWSMATDLSQTHSQTLEDRATQLLGSRSGALVTQFNV